jgi:MmyB-like transcription regulator ligand binding domain
VVGELDLTCETMTISADAGLTMFVYTAEPARAAERG